MVAQASFLNKAQATSHRCAGAVALVAANLYAIGTPLCKSIIGQQGDCFCHVAVTNSRSAQPVAYLEVAYLPVARMKVAATQIALSCLIPHAYHKIFAQQPFC